MILLAAALRLAAATILCSHSIQIRYAYADVKVSLQVPDPTGAAGRAIGSREVTQRRMEG